MSGWRDIRSGVAGRRDALINSLRRPEQQQWTALRQILERNRDTEFGKRFGFSGIRTVADFQNKVPLGGYEDVRVDIERMMAGAGNVLCADDVLLFEQTGGTTGGSKFIPLTQGALAAVRRAVLPWLDDLLATRPGISKGRAYWAISPVVRQPLSTSGGIPIGIVNDSAYFGNDLTRAIDETLAVPASVSSISTVDEWRYTTLCHLLASGDLSFVSVWSPTFFLELVDALSNQSERLITALETGRIGTGKTTCSTNTAAIAADPARARELGSLLGCEQIRMNEIWPMLDTISCWSSASSRRYADKLGRRFPGTHIQGKGLLATEGVVTIPLEDACSPVLAVDSGFYEFVTDGGEVLLPSELEIGQSYAVVLTSESGLYRYQLGDRVVAKGWFEATPCLEYVGRKANASDLCGEKLTEEFVENVLGGIPGFGVLVPMTTPRPTYLLLLDEAISDAGQEGDVARLADRSLMTNPQYRYAREIGQLAPPEARRIADPVGTYKRICIASGQRLGDIKPASLASASWAKKYLGAMAI